MIIDFDSMEKTVFHEFKGGNKDFIAQMYTDPLGKIMKGCLKPGASIGMHTHETNSEMIYILKGKASILYDEGTEEVSAGNCHYCPKGHSHSMRNHTEEDLIFFAVVPEQ